MISSIFLLLAMFHYTDQRKIEGRKRLQKLVCILKHGRDIPFTYNFKPYYYGPYSEELTDAVDTMVGLGLLEEKKQTLASGIVKYVYELTPQGNEKVTENLKKIQEHMDLDKFKVFSEELERKPTEDLVIESKRVLQFYS